MQQYIVSHDFLDAKPIAMADLERIAFDPGTSNEFADYLQQVLIRAKTTMGKIGVNIDSISFTMHENGAVNPFGLGSWHSYTKNFYMPVKGIELPPLPPSMLFANN